MSGDEADDEAESRNSESDELNSVKTEIANCGNSKTDCADINSDMASKAAVEVDRKLKTNGIEQVKCTEWLKTKLVADTLKLEKEALDSNTRTRRSTSDHSSFNYIKVLLIPY